METKFDRSQRQILVNLGNRYVIFGPSGGLPRKFDFDPVVDSIILPRVADESEVAHTRIAETLRVVGMEKTFPLSDEPNQPDLVLSDKDGNRVLVEVKVRQGDPKGRDLSIAWERSKEAKQQGLMYENWFFNVDRLKLLRVYWDHEVPIIEESVPLDVWEKTPESIFRRANVVAEVEDWIFRLDVLYNDVESWLSTHRDFRFERNRTVTMSEEMMQNFAVTDRDVPILDVIEGDQVVASFVPRGLWMIGAWGRVDVITRSQTTILVATRDKEEEELRWELVSPEDRRKRVPFNKDSLIAIVGAQ